ncbi:hypothetical protein V1512DRAFT_262811 [Lipomyces arxii]|uniref:uncharacterized protein n=1 Tax=Lipomyces arxii TaxID=56418 RepID=UPI0034CD8598
MTSNNDEDALFQDLYGDENEETIKKPDLGKAQTPAAYYGSHLGEEYNETEEDYGTSTELSNTAEAEQSTNNQNDSRETDDSSREDGKMFIGGLNWDTTDESLNKYFSQFGEVTECQVMRDPSTGRSRGFGFLTFRDSKCVNTVMVKEHYLDGKIIDPKRAIPKDEQEKTSKIFVGGIAPNVNEAEFRDAFVPFGRVLDTSLMIDKETGRSRGFGFITFDSDAGVDNTIANCPLVIGGKMVEVKKAQPRGREKADLDDDGRIQYSNLEDNYQQNSTQGEYDESDAYYQSGVSEAMLAKYWHSMQAYMLVALQQFQTGEPPAQATNLQNSQNVFFNFNAPQQRQQHIPTNHGREYMYRQGHSESRISSSALHGGSTQSDSKKTTQSFSSTPEIESERVDNGNDSREAPWKRNFDVESAQGAELSTSASHNGLSGNIPSGPRAFRNSLNGPRQSTRGSGRGQLRGRGSFYRGNPNYHPYHR